MNHLLVDNLRNKTKITSLNLYRDKKEEILDSKLLKLKDNSFTILTIIMGKQKVPLGQHLNKKNIKMKNLYNMNFVKSIPLSDKTKKRE